MLPTLSLVQYWNPYNNALDNSRNFDLQVGLVVLYSNQYVHISTTSNLPTRSFGCTNQNVFPHGLGNPSHWITLMIYPPHNGIMIAFSYWYFPGLFSLYQAKNLLILLPLLYFSSNISIFSHRSIHISPRKAKHLLSCKIW